MNYLCTLIISLLNLISNHINRLNLLSLCFNLSKHEFNPPLEMPSSLNYWHKSEESTYWA